MAQEPLSLSRAIEIGLANNFQLEIAKRNLELAENNNTWSAAGKGPRVAVSYTHLTLPTIYSV